MNSLKCNHCGWQGSIHDVSGITLSELKLLEQELFKSSKPCFDNMNSYNGICPQCLSLNIVHNEHKEIG